MNQDFVDLLRAFAEADVSFLIVGAYALAIHAKPRATGDLDVWIEPTPENARRVMQALIAFGAPLDQVSEGDFTRPGLVFQVGLPPRRIDILTDLTGLSYSDAWADRTTHRVSDLDVGFLGRRSLIVNKRATGRAQDLADLELLGE